MNTLNEAQEFFVSAQDRAALKKYKDSPEWGILKGVVESSLLKWTANLLTGTEIETGFRAKELERLSGFVYYWQKLTRLVEEKEEKKEEYKAPPSARGPFSYE